jgi:hypothetical protein
MKFCEESKTISKFPDAAPIVQEQISPTFAVGIEKQLILT